MQQHSFGWDSSFSKCIYAPALNFDYYTRTTCLTNLSLNFLGRQDELHTHFVDSFPEVHRSSRVERVQPKWNSGGQFQSKTFTHCKVGGNVLVLASVRFRNIWVAWRCVRCKSYGLWEMCIYIYSNSFKIMYTYMWKINFD